MTVPYLLRLVCLSLACYFLVHTALAAVVWAVSARAVRMAQRLRPRDAGRLLLALRFLPVVLACLAVAGLCVPSFLWLEPLGSREAAGAVCLAAALLGAAAWAAAMARGGRGVWQSRRYLRQWNRQARPERAGGVAVWVLDAAAPALALAGIRRSQVWISRGLLQALPPEQLAAALRHEEAHRQSHDNLKRLALLLAPEILPGVRAFAALERGWARASEWAADDAAAAGGVRRRLALADALVRAARLGCMGRPPDSLVTTLIPEPADLAARVTRLLDEPLDPGAGPHGWMAAGIAAAALAILAAQPGTLYSVHWLLEGLMR